MAFSSVCNSSSARLLDNDELQAWHGESDGGISSGYDSGDVYDSDAEPQTGNVTLTSTRYSKPETEVAQLFDNPLLFTDSDTDSDSLSDPDDSDTDDDSDSEFGDEDDDAMRFTSTENLCDSLRYILSMPELCDVTFHVGPQKTPIHGVKAILGTRSRVLYGMILKAERELEKTQKTKPKHMKSKKQKAEKTDQPTRLSINVDTYEPDVFRRIIQFVHSGSVNVDSSSVIGLICGAEGIRIEGPKNGMLGFHRSMYCIRYRPLPCCDVTKSTAVQPNTGQQHF
ncbi:serine-enriched protein-like [Pecten maximus]|uniref:serine-enriched protein-like n=1 Tax=Pecten maximus TaxID=6579 RepID=UPI00145897C5|nr:serine-enriched protein-like [Pecten maximus]